MRAQIMATAACAAVALASNAEWTLSVIASLRRGPEEALEQRVLEARGLNLAMVMGLHAMVNAMAQMRALGTARERRIAAQAQKEEAAAAASAEDEDQEAAKLARDCLLVCRRTMAMMIVAAAPWTTACLVRAMEGTQRMVVGQFLLACVGIGMVELAVVAASSEKWRIGYGIALPSFVGLVSLMISANIYSGVHYIAAGVVLLGGIFSQDGLWCFIAFVFLLNLAEISSFRIPNYFTLAVHGVEFVIFLVAGFLNQIQKKPSQDSFLSSEMADLGDTVRVLALLICFSQLLLGAGEMVPHSYHNSLQYGLLYSVGIYGLELGIEVLLSLFQLKKNTLQAVMLAWDSSFFKDVTSFLFGLKSFWNNMKDLGGKETKYFFRITACIGVLLISFIAMSRRWAEFEEPLLHTKRVLKSTKMVVLGSGNKTASDEISGLDAIAKYSSLWSWQDARAFCTLKGVLDVNNDQILAALPCLACSSVSQSEILADIRKSKGKNLLAECMDRRNAQNDTQVTPAANELVQYMEENVLNNSNGVHKSADSIEAQRDSSEHNAWLGELAAEACKEKRMGRGFDSLLQEKLVRAVKTAVDRIGLSQAQWWCSQSKITRGDATRIFDYAVLTSQRRDFVASAWALQTLLDRDPLHANGWYELGVSQARLGTIDLSKISFRKAIHLDPKNLTIANVYAEALKLSGDAKGTEEQYRKTILLAVEQENFAYAMKIRTDLCHFHLDAHNDPEVIACASEDGNFLGLPFWIEYMPVALLNHRGIARARLDDDLNALLDFQEAIELSDQLAKENSTRYSKDSHADAYNNIGSLLFSQEKYFESRQNLEQALRIIPDHHHAQRNLDILAEELAHIPVH